MIPISKPLLGQEEIEAVKKVLNSGLLVYGREAKKFETDFSEYVGTKFAIATNSGTSALHTALSSIGVKGGDEVITTTFSFIATASCILMQGAKPILCDIDPKTYNISPDQIEKRITKKTKAIIVVHLYGQPCDMRPILDIAEDHGLFVIEDACQAHGAECNGKKVGSLGDIGCFSFYPTKNMTTGEGGMITTDDEEIARKARMIINHGRKDVYLHGILGYNYRMTEIAGAIGRVQLKKLDISNKKRINNARFYDEELDWVEKPYVADCVKHVYHQYTIRVKIRDKFIKYLEKNGIGYGLYYPIPIHRQPLFEGYRVTLPNAENASKEVVSIPVHPALSEAELKKVARVVNAYGRG
jgi:perosamine synthetase